MANTSKFCSICRKGDEECEQIEFGGWKTLNGQNFHYFCVVSIQVGENKYYCSLDTIRILK